MGVRNDILSLIYLMNKEARMPVKTPVGETGAILLTNLVRQGTVLGQVLVSFRKKLKHLFKVQVTQIFGLNIFSYFKNMGSNRGFHKVFSILAFAKHV